MTCPDMEGLSPRRSPCLVYCSMAAILKFLTLPLSVSFQVKSDETMEQACEQRTQQAAKRMRAQVWQAGAVQNVLGPWGHSQGQDLSPRQREPRAAEAAAVAAAVGGRLQSGSGAQPCCICINVNLLCRAPGYALSANFYKIKMYTWTLQ